MIQQGDLVVAPELEALSQQLNRALLGKQEVIQMVIACLLARGHLLFEDLPGLGKTTLAKSLARSIGGKFSRVQCTPDLLPNDISGFNIFNQKNQEFEFHPGPVFADLLLADEINRTSPRTQSALLEAMAERQVTIDNQTYTLSPTFMVIATQNPIESHGAFPLPEAQLDRFAIKLSIGYLQRQNEIDLLGGMVGAVDSPSDAEPVMSRDQLHQIQEQVRAVEVCEPIRGYLVDLGQASREHPRIDLGLSPRGLITWLQMSQAWAFLQGRGFVIPEDVQAVAGPVLRLRLSESPANTESIISEILESVPVPGE